MAMKLLLASVSAFAVTVPGLAQTAEPQPAQGGSAGTAELAAAEEAGESETIIVTGSRISRAGFDTLQPAVVISGEQIDNRGYTNIGQALAELPAFGVPGNSPVGAQSSFGPAQTFVDFFSLGTQRTLTLVNGRRFVSSNTASIFGPVDAGSQVDLNVIPTALIDRIETIAVGGAPIYGSDAIAGTVNIRLRRDYQGVRLDAQTGISARGDAPEFRLRGVAGTNFSEGRGNITIAGEYNKVTGLTTQDRFRTSSRGAFFVTPADPNSPFGQVLEANQRFNIFTADGVPLAGDSIPEFAGITDANGNIQTFGPDGRLQTLDFGVRTGSLIESIGGNGFPLRDFGNLLTSSERYLGTLLTSYQLTDGIRFFGEGWYANSKGTNLRDQPVYNTALFDSAGTPDGNIIIGLDNPFLHPADRALIASNLGAGETSFLLTRANTDLATGRASATVEVWRLVGGFDGQFQLGQRSVNWEVSATYGRSTTQGNERVLVQQNFENAVDAVLDANGNITCRPGVVNATIPTLSSTCAPLNLFGSGRASKEALEYVTAIADPRSVNTQLVLNANLTSELFTLPGGGVSFAAGYEHRRETTDFDPGAFYFGEDNGNGTRTQYGRSIPIDPISGSFNTHEVFGELRIPLISPEMGVGFVHRLEVEGAARYVDNSLSGGDLTWTAGGRFEPVRGVTFRGNFTRSIRSPAITEVFNPTSPAFATANDPCDERFIDGGPNPANRAANCAAAGITQPFTSNIVDFTSRISVSGNPDLENERADSWTVGAVLRPTFVPNLTLAVDWVSIKLKDAIVSLDTEQTLEACYDATSFPNAICGAIDRDAAGQVTFVRTGFANAASQEFAGLTAELSYVYPFGEDMRVGASLNYLYVDKQFQRVGTGDIDTSVGEIGNPRHSGTLNLNFQKGGLNLLWQTQYFGKAVIDADGAPDAFDIPGNGDWWLFNATIGYDVSEQFGLKLIVDNVFDVSPPSPRPAEGGTVTYYSGLVGRFVRLAATVRF